MRVMLGHVTRMSRQRLASGIDHEMETDCPLYDRASKRRGVGTRDLLRRGATEGKPIRLVKFMTYHNSRSAGCAELVERADRALDRARRGGIDKLLAEQEAYLAEFWDRADVVVRGDPAIQQIIRFNLFHIAQASARAERIGIPAKGLTGDGYEGHYFWDAET